MKTKINNPQSLDELKNQLSWLEVLDKSKQSIIVLWDYVSKGAAILFVNGKLLSVKWYNIFGIIKLITVGKLFVSLIIDIYKIWSYDIEK